MARVLGADRLAKLWESITGRPCRSDGRQQLFNPLPAVGSMRRRVLGVT